MERLRSPGGCPWDREQSFDSIRKYTLEETYEVFDAIERRDWPALKDELGDLLLQVLFYAQMASEAGHFTIDDVTASLNRKLIRRHPHVFGEEAAAAAGNSATGLDTAHRCPAGPPQLGGNQEAGESAVCHDDPHRKDVSKPSRAPCLRSRKPPSSARKPPKPASTGPRSPV